MCMHTYITPLIGYILMYDVVCFIYTHHAQASSDAHGICHYELSRRCDTHLHRLIMSKCDTPRNHTNHSYSETLQKAQADYITQQVCMYLPEYVYMYVYMFMFTHIYVHMYMYVCMCISVCAYVYMYACMCVSV